ncbi:MAG: entericidin A/B family lipoprotein [Azoarcus sp.]|nr:entericidin A/B family lipoprotein [Azoarcus sp.]
MSFGFALLFALSLVACNTVRGVGRDIEAGGKAIQKATR